MKNWILVLAIFLTTSSSFANVNLKSVRDYYFKVNLEEISLDKYEDYISNLQNDARVEIKAYEAVVWFLRAKDYLNPMNKLEAFLEGKKQFKLLIDKHPNNLELRFLRYTIQDNAPVFLGYKDELKEDHNFLVENMNNTKDNDLQKRILNYLKSNKND